MTEQFRDLHLTADEFFAWTMTQPGGRYELHYGKVVAMSPERVVHTRTKYETYFALRSAILTKGLDCEALGDGVSVRIDEKVVYEPDALVRCGPRTPGEAVEIDDPLIVVEVASPSTRGVDTGAKLAGYFRLASVRHYLIVQPEARAVVHHRRDEEGAITTRILRDGRLALDPPGLDLAIADLFPS
jgi:Uma2 family endonuclease